MIELELLEDDQYHHLSHHLNHHRLLKGLMFQLLKNQENLHHQNYYVNRLRAESHQYWIEHKL